MEPKVIVITGTSRGLGQAIRRHLQQQGHVVYGSSRSEVDADEHHLRLDVTAPESCQSAVAQVLKHEGHIDVLINNAGSHFLGAAAETSTEELRAQFELNFFGAVHMTQQVLPTMLSQRSGRIINVSSVGGRIATPFASAYCASKFALEGYFGALRLEVLPFGIFVSNLQPGYLATGTTEQSIVQVDGEHPLYAKVRRDAWDRMQHEGKRGTALSRVTQVVDRVLRARRPRLSYTVDGLAVRLELLRAVSPPSVFERAVTKQLAPGLGT